GPRMTTRLSTFLFGCALLAPLSVCLAAPDKSAGVSDKVKQAAAAQGPTSQPVVPMGDDRKPHVKPKDGEVLACAIQELGNFQYDQEKGGNIRKDVLALTGSKVRLVGFMIPLDQADKIKQFVLVPDLF